MTQKQLFAPLTKHQLENLSSDEIRRFVDAQARVIVDQARELQLLKNRREEIKQTSLQIDEDYVTIKAQVFGSSASPTSSPQSRKDKKRNKKKKVQLPSERYPEAEIFEQEIGFKETPSCDCCGGKMSFSGMFEICESLTVSPAVFRVIRQKRQKYRCGCCHGDIKTVPPMPRICPGSAYSDEMMIDVALSKYCDLIPIERYAAIAGRNGLINLPPQSLIQLTHYLADFIKPIYDRIREEVLLNRVIHADESVPRMQILEERSLQCCINDEGRPLGIGLRRLVSNNLKLHLSKAGVVSVKEKAEHRFCHVSSRKMSASEPLLKASKHGDDVKTRIFSLSWDKYRQNPFMDCTASGVEEA